MRDFQSLRAWAAFLHGTPVRSASPVIQGTTERHLMAGKNKGGREDKKPKAESNKKTKGQTPPAGGGASLDAINHKAKPKK